MESGERESSDGNGVGGNICGEAFHAEGAEKQDFNLLSPMSEKKK